ncbi:crotonase/enoyl-CoA hydratase family protein [Sphingomonas mali]|uniref:crotonase/enoyl-CoA hydratase family protein n=1 Tax=Sphingomonas mali TaxID=40682 RepID=UPI000832BEC1|nr:crotonase/enoyl-CoA hydratase family protein [Sphingomonas mali]
MTEIAESAVLVERRGAIMIITINRPEARNAVNQAVHIGMGEALEAAEHDPAIRAVIVTGAGDQAFCAGADLKALARGEDLRPADPVRRAWGFAGFVEHPIGKPIIAAVNGFALGGGTEIALASDIVIAADAVNFGLPEVKRGIYAGAGGAIRLARQLPPKIAMEYLLTGEPFSADRALALGLVNRVVPAAELLPTALAIAEQIAGNAPLSVQASKRIAMGIANGTIAAEQPAWEISRAEGAALFQSEDAKEGPRAFAEKRAPVWQAR